jgi:hypothetical protein
LSTEGVYSRDMGRGNSREGGGGGGFGLHEGPELCERAAAAPAAAAREDSSAKLFEAAPRARGAGRERVGDLVPRAHLREGRSVSD